MSNYSFSNENLEASDQESAPQSPFQPMAIQNLLIPPTSQHNQPSQSPSNTPPVFSRSPQAQPIRYNPIVSPTLISNGRYAPGSLLFNQDISQEEEAQSPEQVDTSSHGRSALFLSQFQSISGHNISQNGIRTNSSESQNYNLNESSNRHQENSRDENGLSYGLSRLVAPSGGSESRSDSASPRQVPYHMSFFGGTATQRLPSMSPISLENNFVQSPLESPISRDLISPSTRTSFNIAPRSPTTRRLRANQQDAITRRYFRQVMYGCSKQTCQYFFCASHPNFIPRDIKEATALSLTLSQHGEEYLCPDVPEADSSESSVLPVPLQKTLRNELARDPRKRHKNIKMWASLEQLNSLELQPNLQLETLKNNLLQAQQSGEFETFAQTVYTVFSRINLLSSSFTQRDEDLRQQCPVDLEQVKESYDFILKECPKMICASILSGTATLFDKLKLGLEVIREQHLSALLIVLLNPLLMEPSNHSEILPKFCDIFAGLCDKYLSLLTKYIVTKRFASHDPAREASRRGKDFQHMVSVFQQFITMRLLMKSDQSVTPNKDEFVMKATTCLGLLYRINEDYGLIPYTEFYNDAVNEQIEIKEDFPRFRSRNGFSFCNFPFVLNPATKSDILKVESMFQMRQELQDAFFRALFVGVNSPYLVLEIRRDYIIRDALFQLSSKSPQDLKKQLRVQFIGEEGVDEGGVQKEFFQLLVREMFDPKYGMFTTQEDQRLYWFNPNPLDDDIALEEYRLIGRLIGLAIYNSVILDLHFPGALYKKLMGNAVGLDDLEVVDPSLGRGLRCLLGFQDDVEAAYGWTFQIEYEVVGERFKYDLKPNGANIPLKNDNREEFVELYIDFILNKAIERQFKAFREGFDHVCAGSAIQLFRPEEVEQLVCGSSDLDFEALEKVTQYDGGFTAATPVIMFFWEVVHSFTEAQKKMLLFFATGSDRVPIGGLSKLQFVIAKNGPDSDRLPTSHTCFNVLLLCEYGSLEKLRERLLTAIHNAEGFGMI
ncbi:hypothetical protein DSO57_1011273 [Entomophthora muscae]|uniref:Uncharacterized protein n=1 Tax=Entomophthora muscae TaxID=34485 RepID=A0ACC2TUE0_9FUNG|nr:hypothetical protein DSO57_1011273 [Entomophthora muscae]